MPKAGPVSVSSLCNRKFVVYAASDGTIYLERVRRSGRRGRKSIFQFDPTALASAIEAVLPIRAIAPPADIAA